MKESHFRDELKNLIKIDGVRMLYENVVIADSQAGLLNSLIHYKTQIKKL